MTPSDAKAERARRASARRAFSLMELISVVAILGLIAGVAMLRFGHNTLNTTDTEGFVRRLALDLRHARRATIATGADHYVQFNRTAGAVTSYDLYRQDGGGDFTVQPATPVPADTTVTTAIDTWQFDFSGALTTGGASSSLTVEGANYAWGVDVYQATGAVRTNRTPQP